MKRLLGHQQLLRLDISVFLLHLLITATFFDVPMALREAGVARDAQWVIYLPAVLLSVGMMVPLIIVAEKRAMRGVLLFCVAGLLLAQVLFGWLPTTTVWLFVSITLFFGFLNGLEALLPSLVSRLAPAAAKGSAMGIYSSSQFFGSFVGGAGAGWLYGYAGPSGMYLVLIVLCAVWIAVLSGFVPPMRVTTHRRALSSEEKDSPDHTIAKMQALPGVLEVVLAVDEGVAYIKVDKNRFVTATND
jgi:MFS family permease